MMVASCGGTSSKPSSLSEATQLVARFPTTVLGPGPVRLPMSLADANGGMLTGGPDAITAEVVDLDGRLVSQLEPTLRRQQAAGTPVFYSFRAEIDAPGVYAIRTGSIVASFQVFEPSQVPVPRPGSVLAGFDTPTFDNPRGVDPICSRVEGPCPLHERTLTDMLSDRKPVVYIVGTPGHCQTATCAPGLDHVLTAAKREGAAVNFVHADVYTDDSATITTDAIAALSLTYEPVLFVCDATGTIVERLDAIWDQAEVDAAISAAK